MAANASTQKVMIVGPTKQNTQQFKDTFVWTLDHPRYPGVHEIVFILFPTTLSSHLFGTSVFT
jgi:hypothetical protein